MIAADDVASAMLDGDDQDRHGVQQRRLGEMKPSRRLSQCSPHQKHADGRSDSHLESFVW